jgi:hypothetical protein
VVSTTSVCLLILFILFVIVYFNFVFLVLFSFSFYYFIFYYRGSIISDCLLRGFNSVVLGSPRPRSLSVEKKGKIEEGIRLAPFGPRARAREKERVRERGEKEEEKTESVRKKWERDCFLGRAGG